MTQEDTHCPIAASDIDGRYLAGKLSEGEAEEFERHYFECEECWENVRRGSEIRAAIGEGRTLRRRSYFRRPQILALAAVLLLAVGLWSIKRPASLTEDSHSPAGAGAMRGSDVTLDVSAAARDNLLIAAWSPARGARSYHVRLLSADGRLLLERFTSDTSVAFASDSVGAAKTNRVFWEVEALNDLRRVIATSALTDAGIKISGR